MFSPDDCQRYYQALLEKNRDYEGLFYVGVKTTGVFCRPTCPARKPKYENCEFFQTAQQALLASYRPCLRCRPLSHPNQVSELARTLVEAVEANPEKRWKEADFAALSIDAVTARRQFQKRFGMSFVDYGRARRMGLAMKQIRDGNSVIDAQIASGYESASGFRDAFSRILGAVPSKLKPGRGHQHHYQPKSGEQASLFPESSRVLQPLKAAWLDTRLGPLLAIADDDALHLLEFVDRRGLEREVERLRLRLKLAVIPGRTPVTGSIERELAHYFAGTLIRFQTPLARLGSPFQRAVWVELEKIPPGETRSYSDIAAAMGQPSALRAVAQANGANQLAIVIPCHRVINADGELGGYGGGLCRKQWLLAHERQMATAQVRAATEEHP